MYLSAAHLDRRICVDFNCRVKSVEVRAEYKERDGDSGNNNKKKQKRGKTAH